MKPTDWELRKYDLVEDDVITLYEGKNKAKAIRMFLKLSAETDNVKEDYVLIKWVYDDWSSGMEIEDEWYSWQLPEDILLIK